MLSNQIPVRLKNYKSMNDIKPKRIVTQFIAVSISYRHIVPTCTQGTEQRPPEDEEQ